MEWEPNDEVVLGAALKNRLSGDLEVRPSVCPQTKRLVFSVRESTPKS